MWLLFPDDLGAVVLTVRSNFEELLDILVRIWPLCGIDGHLPVSKVIVLECGFLLFFERLGELGIHKEDWSFELFICRIDGLVNVTAWEERLYIWANSYHRVPYCFPGIPFFQRDQFVASAKVWLEGGSLVSPILSSSKVRELTIDLPSGRAIGGCLQNCAFQIGIESHRSTEQGGVNNEFCLCHSV